MSKNLVIVESPAKAKTIKKYLGADFEVLASYGHVRDLMPKDGAVDTENGFEMKYQVIERNEKHVRAISSALKKADALYLATDPDREGEAISWHLVELLKEKNALKGKPVKRVVFHEITKSAVNEAIANPRDVAFDLVNAQQARRALDYLVGFNLSPLLWRKVSPGLSAGRVQSPALRLICEREAEIRAFVAQEYWTLEARVKKENSPFTARLVELDGKKFEQFTLTDQGGSLAAKERILAAARDTLLVKKVDKKQRKRNPAPPFTTSTLQQEANRKLGFTSTRTMRAAQQLYEGVDIGGETVGLISYMRTDSVSLAKEAVSEIRDVILTEYGAKGLPEEPRFFKAKSKNAQEAHEAIRPTSAARLPKDMIKHLGPDQARLYELIWRRAVASQMTPAISDTVAVELRASADHAFRANGSVLIEPGFLAAYNIKAEDPKDRDEGDEDDKRLPALEEGEQVELLELVADQHFTEPPPRYTEASLVKILEEYDIGRPSTYASIISTLQSRNYVLLEGKAFNPTDVGMIVNRFLSEHFGRYVDYGFTANLEDELDSISRGEREWVPVLEAFWGDFKKQVDEKQELTRQEVSEARVIGTDPVSGKPVSARLGRYGPFVQIGTKEDEDKPKFASLRGKHRIDTITLEEALELFKLPRELGHLETGEEVVINIGRFGPYARYGKKFVSLKKDDDPYTVTLERAIELVEQKEAALKAATIKDFPGSEIRIIKGRFGPYITDGEQRANIPKTRDAEKFSVLDCEFFLNEAAEKAKAARKGKGGKKSAAAKKAPAKKAAKKVVKKAAKKKVSKKASKKTVKAVKKAEESKGVDDPAA